MTGLEVVLIITGFVCLCVSLFVARRSTSEQPAEEGIHSADVWTEKEEQLVRERINQILSDRQNELVETTEEQMNRLCNDKIIAVDEFSRQILEKIENNHQEVVFMYNMLNDKEKEVKHIMTEPVKAREEKEEKEEKTVAPKPSPQPQSQSPSPSQSQTAISQLKSKAESRAMTKSAETQVERKAAAPAEKKSEKMTVPGNVNLQIQKMHKEGKSVLEISKALNIGQGEVKLVIALYGGKKG